MSVTTHAIKPPAKVGSSSVTDDDLARGRRIGTFHRLVGTIALLSLTSALNPTLIAATTVMLLLPHPKRLMLGYLLGAFAISIPLGVVIVLTLGSSGVVGTTQHTVSPAIDIALGALALVLALVIGSARTERSARASARGEGRPRQAAAALAAVHEPRVGPCDVRDRRRAHAPRRVLPRGARRAEQTPLLRYGRRR